MFDDEEISILAALENNQLLGTVNVDQEIAFAKQAAKEFLSKEESEIEKT